MDAPYRRATLERAVDLPLALGVVSGRVVTASLHPAEIGSGLRLRRTDIDREWPVDVEHLVPLPNCTAIGEPGQSVAILEHLLAALRAARISDVLITADGGELSLFDGSGRVLWEAVQSAGRAESEEPWEPLVVREPLKVEKDAAYIEVTPADTLSLSYELQHSHPLIGHQEAQFNEGDDFATQLAPARTFATSEEIQALSKEAPTSLVEQICVVVYPDRISDLRLPPNAFARHKLLDLYGDLFLAGRIVHGRISAHLSGHALNHDLVSALLAQG